MMRTALIVNPKYEVNVASLSRTLFVFGAPLMPRCGTPIKKGGRSADVPKSERHLPTPEVGSPKDLRLLLGRGTQLVAVDTADWDRYARMPKPLGAAMLLPDVCFILGNESNGLDAEWVEAADLFVTIPMLRPGSLNVSVAGAVCIATHAAKWGQA